MPLSSTSSPPPFSVPSPNPLPSSPLAGPAPVTAHHTMTSSSIPHAAVTPVPRSPHLPLKFLASLFLLTLLVSTTAQPSTNSSSFPTLSIPCTSHADCTPRHPSLFCHPSLQTCAARTCGVSSGLACSLFNATTYCTLPSAGGTCSPRVPRNTPCNPPLDVNAGEFPVPSVQGFKPGAIDWVTQANQQCELGLYCHPNKKMCVGTDVDPGQTFNATSAASTAPGGGPSIGTLMGVLAMAVFTCGCCMLSCGRMCGWQPGQKGGMRWGRVCCGLPGAVVRFVRWVCCCLVSKRKDGQKEDLGGVGLEEKHQHQHKVPTSVERVPSHPQAAPGAGTHVVVVQHPPGSLSASSSSLTTPAPANGIQYYDSNKQQAAVAHHHSPHVSHAHSIPHSPSHRYHFDPAKQHAMLPSAPPLPTSSSSSSSSAHSHSYAQPIATHPPMPQLDPRKHATAAGGFPMPVMATPTPPTATPHVYTHDVPSHAQLQLGKQELGMALGHPPPAPTAHAGYAVPGQPVYMATSAASHHGYYGAGQQHGGTAGPLPMPPLRSG